MAKPICLIRVSSERSESINKIQESLQNKFNDYHVLVIPDLNDADFEMEVFYKKDWKDADIEKMKNDIHKELLELMDLFARRILINHTV